MKIAAIIVASGKGQRMGSDIPKQFLNVLEKPVLIHTLEAFQSHPMIDNIVVVCLEGWQSVVEAYSKQYKITKLANIVTGGATVQESIRNGVYSLEGSLSEDDIVVIHDGVRPIIDQNVLTDVILVCKKYGNGVTSLPYNEQIFIVDDDNEQTTTKYINRDKLRRVSTPQAYNYKLIYDAYHEAYEKEIGIYGSSYANTMMIELGHKLYLAKGSDKNIKLTTPDDFEIFKAIKLHSI